MLFLLAMTLGGVSALAQEVTLDFTKNTWGLPTDYTKTAATYSNGTYKISFGASSNGHKFGGSYLIFGKSGATLSLPAFDFAVEKIVITGNKNASASVKQNIFVGDKAASTETTGAQGTNTYEIAEAYQAAGNIYTLKVLNNKNTQVTKIEIYKKGGVEKTSTTTTFGTDYDGKTISLKPGESFTAPAATLTPAEAGTLAYSSSNTEVATVDATTGAVTLTGTTGKTTITAAFAGNDTYTASSASYTLNVAEALSLTGAGTKESPYTVADVLAIVGADQQTTDSVYVKGIVSKIKTTADNIVKYKNCDYYLIDKEGATDTIMAFRGKYLGNTDFTSADQLKVGDKVLVFGVLTKYNDIVELAKDNYIVEFLGEDASKDVTVTVGEALYTTLYYSDRNLVVPENAKAYTYSAEFGNGLEESHRYNAAEVIPAGEAVVVFALGAGDYTFKATDTTGYDDDTNMLFGTDEETAIADDANYYFYKLSLDSNGKNVGFYWGAANGAAFTNGAHKAYLKVSKNQTKAKAFLFNGGATAIKTVSFDNAGANAPVFNMAGQRVDKSFKGIVIRNGKKFVK